MHGIPTGVALPLPGTVCAFWHTYMIVSLAPYDKEPGLTWLVVNPKWHKLTGTGIHGPASNVSVISE